MSRTVHDPGLRAVARVRGVRERDSRLGLQTALREQRAHELRVAELEQAVRDHAGFVSGDLAEFVALRQSLAALRHAAVEARSDLDTSRRLALDAGARWRADKARLGAVEGLLERRADERAAEAARGEAVELDEVAGRLWLRAEQAAQACEPGTASTAATGRAAS
ncbi:flagellar FliJ family protein [Nocardioides sp. Leaf374]|uniref:flagellar FliJ family protein n=1 Tax=Nocardioides sp. Leaf374 TaxID=2876560 RepID=UPI001E47A6C2|nr:flagellar FliJ family protein [Nocardioides sp. Leaf374]